MRSRYEVSSWGWNEVEKQSEMFAPESIFLLLLDNSEQKSVEGYCIFRFCWDDEEEPKVSNSTLSNFL